MEGQRVYPVIISSGIFTPTHRKKIGISLWEFEWLIFRVTKIDEYGRGLVEGGKPIKIPRIAKELGLYKKTIANNLKRLEKEGYIFSKRTPYGYTIWVNKVKKRLADFYYSRVVENAPESSRKLLLRVVENYPNKEDSSSRYSKDMSLASDPTPMKTPNENAFSDFLEKKIDIDTGEELTPSLPQEKNNLVLMWDLIKWARKEKREGRDFPNLGKQFKALSNLARLNIQPREIKARWNELEEDKFYEKTGIDFATILNSYDKKP